MVLNCRASPLSPDPPSASQAQLSRPGSGSGIVPRFWEAKQLQRNRPGMGLGGFVVAFQPPRVAGKLLLLDCGSTTGCFLEQRSCRSLAFK